MGIYTSEAWLQGGDYVGYLTLTRVQRVMAAAYGSSAAQQANAARAIAYAFEQRDEQPARIESPSKMCESMHD